MHLLVKVFQLRLVQPLQVDTKEMPLKRLQATQSQRRSSGMAPVIMVSFLNV